jgi:hypothetical protein
VYSFILQSMSVTSAMSPFGEMSQLIILNVLFSHVRKDRMIDFQKKHNNNGIRGDRRRRKRRDRRRRDRRRDRRRIDR